MNHLVLSIARKEALHILRDFQSLLMVLLMPLLMLVLYGYAVTLEMRQIDTAVIDESHTPQSRELVDRFESSGFFRITARGVPLAEIAPLFEARIARCVLIIPSSFARDLVADRSAKLSLVVDATDPNAAALIDNYVTTVVSSFAASLSGRPAAPFVVIPRILYNPEMRSTNFFVPGLIALILILITSLLTSMTIARERETGTIEQLLVSPLRPVQLILGKVLPYVAIGLFDGLLILVAGSLWFKVPIRGSLLLIVAMMLIYVMSGISLGVLVSTVSRTQAVAMFAAVVATVLPSFMLSGFIYPISSMAPQFRWLSAITPATYFLEIIRGIVLKGDTLAVLYRQALILIGMDLLFILASIRAFRLRLG